MRKPNRIDAREVEPRVRRHRSARVGPALASHASLDDAVRGDGVCVMCVPDDGAGGLKTKKHAVQNEAIVDAIGTVLA